MRQAGAVTADDLRLWLIDPTGNAQPASRLSRGESHDAITVGMRLEDMERRLIEATLEHFGGHRAKAAQALGIGIRTLTNKLRQYGYAPRARTFRQSRLTTGSQDMSTIQQNRPAIGKICRIDSAAFAGWRRSSRSRVEHMRQPQPVAAVRPIPAGVACLRQLAGPSIAAACAAAIAAAARRLRLADSRRAAGGP